MLLPPVTRVLADVLDLVEPQRMHEGLLVCAQIAPPPFQAPFPVHLQVFQTANCWWEQHATPQG
jgi:hypothetical protein